MDEVVKPEGYYSESPTMLQDYVEAGWIHPDAEAVYTRLDRLSNSKHDNQAWPSYETLASMVGKSRRHVINMVKELTAAGFVVVEKRKATDGQQSSNLYRVWRTPARRDDWVAARAQDGSVDVSGMEPVSVQDSGELASAIAKARSAHHAPTPPSAGDAPTPVQEVHPGSAHDAPNKELDTQDSCDKEIAPTNGSAVAATPRHEAAKWLTAKVASDPDHQDNVQALCELLYERHALWLEAQGQKRGPRKINKTWVSEMDGLIRNGGTQSSGRTGKDVLVAAPDSAEHVAKVINGLYDFLARNPHDKIASVATSPTGIRGNWGWIRQRLNQDHMRSNGAPAAVDTRDASIERSTAMAEAILAKKGNS